MSSKLPNFLFCGSMLCAVRYQSGMQLAGKYARALSSSGSSDIVVLGASVLDMVAYVDRMPAKSETVLGNNFGMSFGGKGANQAVVAAKLGGTVV